MLDKNKIIILSTAIICIFFLTACTQTANYNKTDDTSSLLPVGSVVKVNDLGNMLIISIGEIDSNNQLYDYKGCSYPEGCTGNTYLFNRDDIISIKHKGYNSKEEVNYIKNIEKEMEELK